MCGLVCEDACSFYDVEPHDNELKGDDALTSYVYCDKKDDGFFWVHHVFDPHDRVRLKDSMRYFCLSRCSAFPRDPFSVKSSDFF